MKGGNAKENQKNTGLPGGNSGTVEQSDKNSTFVMNKIKNRISTEPEVRSERVAELKAQIKNGEFQVNSDSLAKTMLDEALNEDSA